MVPLAWVARERERAILARNDAIRAVILAERAAKFRAAVNTGPSPGSQRGGSTAGEEASAPSPESTQSVYSQAERIAQIERENAELKRTIEQLRREVARLKYDSRR
jgi:hypothetical protein